MTKAFAVVRRGYEYNDEIDQPVGDGDFGTPLTVFKTLEQAKEECFKLARQAYEDYDIGGYTYDSDRLERIMNDLGTENFVGSSMKKGLPDEKAKEIIKWLKEFYDPYFVIEVQSK